MTDKRVFENKVMMKREGDKPIRIQVNKDFDDPESPTETVDMKLEHVLGILVNAMDLGGENQPAIDCGRLSDQVREGRGKDVIILDTGTHQLIKQRAEKVVITAWRKDGPDILEFLKEGFAKDTEPAAKPTKD